MSRNIKAWIVVGTVAFTVFAHSGHAQESSYRGDSFPPFNGGNIFDPVGTYTISTRQSLHQEVLNASTEVALGFAGMHTQYHENALPGDDENGLTAGLHASIGALLPSPLLGRNRDLYTALLFDFSAGNISYGGHFLSTGAPVSATDRAVFNRVEGRLGTGFAFDEGLEITPFLAVGYQAWNRNISNKGEIATDEFYHSFMFGGGIKADLPLTTSTVASAAGEILALAPGGVAADNFGINANFGRTAEERFTLGLDDDVRNPIHLLVEAFWEHFNYSGSKPDNQYGLYEPLSTTTQFGFDLNIAYSF